jgi:hypothetical protein
LSDARGAESFGVRGQSKERENGRYPRNLEQSLQNHDRKNNGRFAQAVGSDQKQETPQQLERSGEFIPKGHDS